MTGLVGALAPAPAKLALTAAPWVALATVSLLAWHFDARAVANAEATRVQAGQFKQAQAAAARIAQAALQHEQAVYQVKAQEEDSAYQAQLADARSDADRYIAAHRVQPAAVAGGGGATAPGSADSSSGIPASLPSGAVVVSTGDVQTCTDAATYALKAHDWANSIAP